MKRRYTFLLTLALSALLLLLLASCGNEKKLLSISIVNPPENTYYEIGESFRVDGQSIEIEALYSDGETLRFPLSSEMVSFSAERVGAATATISYTENGVTARAYLTVTVGDTVRSLRAATVEALTENALYKAHKSDRGVVTLFSAAQIAVYSATDAEGIQKAAADFLSDLEILVSDKKAARDAVAAVSLDGLVGSWLLLAENLRSHTLVEIDIAANSDNALAYATLYKEQVERYRESQNASATAELKAALVVKLRDYFAQSIAGNRGMYSNDGYLKLDEAFKDAEIRILLSETRAEAETIFSDTMGKAKLQATVIDEAYKALAVIYGDRGAVLYVPAVEEAIVAAEAAVEAVRRSQLGDGFIQHMTVYAVAFEERVDGIVYDDGKCNIPAAVEAARMRFEALKTASGDAATASFREKVAAIGTVRLVSKTEIDEARAAYETWYTENGIDTLNAGTVLLGTVYTTLTDAETVYAEKVAAATADAVPVTEAIAAIGTVDLGSNGLLAAARSAYSSFCEAHGEGADAYIATYGSLTAAEDDFAALVAAASAAAGELKTAARELKTAVGSPLDTKQKLDETKQKLNETTDAFFAWLSTYGGEYEETYLTAEVAQSLFSAADVTARSELGRAYMLSPTPEAFVVLTEGNAAFDAIDEAAWRQDRSCFDKIVAEYTARMQGI